MLYMAHSAMFYGKRIHIGDRVRLSRKQCISQKILGGDGTIVGINMNNMEIISLSIDWDELDTGHSCGLRAKPGHGWNIFAEDIDKLTFYSDLPSFHEE